MTQTAIFGSPKGTPKGTPKGDPTVKSVRFGPLDLIRVGVRWISLAFLWIFAPARLGRAGLGLGLGPAPNSCAPLYNERHVEEPSGGSGMCSWASKIRNPGRPHPGKI